MNGLDTTPTRTALLELKDERTVVNEAYEFLDEKRLLLAAEILSQLNKYERLEAQIVTLGREASRRLNATVGRHGLQGTSVYPPVQFSDTRLTVSESNFMGVTLTATELQYHLKKENEQSSASNTTSEAQTCSQTFLELTRQSAVLAGISGNLHRLLMEYRLTERRARALENVILPEIEQTLSIMSTHLEELDLEETVRVHLQKNTPQGKPCGA
jgi:V/A-type H+/Na+-transporting ATPase subunit D